MTVNKDVVECSVHEGGCHEKFHGNRSGACRISEAAQRNDESHEKYHANHGHQVVPGDMLHLRFQSQGIHEQIDAQEITESKEGPHGKPDDYTGSHDVRQGFSFLPAKKVCHNRSACHKESDEGGQ